ncbi:MAG: hypothetical protein ACXWZS_04025 [Gemmatirosa sp.]
MSAHHHDVSRDKGPAFLGLLVGVLFLGAVVYGMVQWTNSRFEGHSAGAAAPAAEAHK